MTGTIGVEPITPELRRYLTDRERRADQIRPAAVVVGRWPGRRPAILGVGRDRDVLLGAAAALAATYAARYVTAAPPTRLRAGDKDVCRVCRGDVVLTVAEVSGRPVPYWQHVEPVRHSDPFAHAPRAGVTA